MQARMIFYDRLRSEFFPRLTALGFIGDEKTYRRIRGEIVSMVTLREHRGGDRCCIELAMHLGFLPASWSRHSLNTEKLTAADCEFQWRLNPPRKHDYWWYYRRWFQSPVRCAGHLIRTFRDRGEALFDRHQSVEDFAGLFSPEDFTTGDWLKAPHGIKPQRGALTMARIHLQLGRLEEARAFARAGLGLISPTTGLAAEYHNILKRSD
jgi:hypothetical protein